MRIYTNKTIKKFYLSPYTQCRADIRAVAFRHTVFDCALTVALRPHAAQKLLFTLKNGVTHAGGVWLLFRCCRTRQPRRLFEELVSGGILE